MIYAKPLYAASVDLPVRVRLINIRDVPEYCVRYGKFCHLMNRYCDRYPEDNNHCGPEKNALNFIQRETGGRTSGTAAGIFE